MANLRLFSNSADETKLSSNRRSTTVTVCLETYPFFRFRHIAVVFPLKVRTDFHNVTTSAT